MVDIKPTRAFSRVIPRISGDLGSRRSRFRGAEGLKPLLNKFGGLDPEYPHTLSSARQRPPIFLHSHTGAKGRGTERLCCVPPGIGRAQEEARPA